MAKSPPDTALSRLDSSGSSLPSVPGAAPPGAGTLFEVDHLQSGLRGRALRGGAIALISQVLRLGLLAVLARLLTIEDFGMYAKVFAVVGFITLFREAGLGTATVHRQQITHAQISTLFWVNLALAAVCAALVVLLAPLLVWVYGDARVLPVAMALAGPTLLAGLSVQHAALLRRQMRFGRTGIIELGSLIVGIGAAVVAAVYGAGYWALVVQQYAATGSRVMLTVAMCPWLPGLPRQGTGVRPMLAFGGNLTGATFLNYINRNADDVLIGAFVGNTALGLYTVAYRLLMMPIRAINAPLTSVAVATLSRLQDQPARFRQYYLRAIGFLTATGMPVVGLLFVTAPAVVELVLGPDWVEAAVIFRLLAPAAFIGTFNVATGWIYLPLGYAQRQLRWLGVTVPLTILVIVAGLPWGAAGVAVAFSATQVILLWPGLWYCYRGTPLRVRDLAATIARPTVASIGAAAILMMLHAMVVGVLPLWSEVAGAAVVYVLIYAAVWFALPGGRAEWVVYWRLARDLRAARGG